MVCCKHVFDTAKQSVVGSQFLVQAKYAWIFITLYLILFSCIGMEWETAAFGNDDVLYALPTPSTIQNGQCAREGYLPDITSPITHGQGRDYLELSSATIPPCDYLRPKDSIKST